jgi:GAF domain-containing protein
VPSGEDATALMHAIAPLVEGVRRSRSVTLSHDPTGADALDQRSRIVVPLIARHQLLGYLYADLGGAYGRFDDADRDLMAMFAGQAAVALDNAQWSDGLEHKVAQRTGELQASNLLLEQRANELAIINSVQQGIAGSLDFQAIVELVGDKLREVLQVKDIGIVWFEMPGRMMHFLYAYEHGERLRLPPMGMLPAIERMIETREPLLAHTAEEQVTAGAAAVPGTDQSRSAIVVPIIGRDRVLGFLTMEDYEREHAYGEPELRLLQTVAAGMGVALENARLFDETQRLLTETERRSSELAVINGIQQGMAKDLGFQAIVELVGDKLREVFATGDMSIRWWDEPARLLHQLYGYEHGKRLEASSLKPEPGTAWHRFLHERRIWVTNSVAEQAAKGIKTAAGTDQARSIVAVPMISGDRMLGAVLLENHERDNAFGADEVRLLSTITASMGVALENAQLFDKTQQALSHQTASAEILRVISSSPTSTDPVFDAILASGARLCEADMGLVLRYEDGVYQTVATLIPDPAFDAFVRQPIKAGPKSGLGRVASARAPVHIPDLLADEAYRERDPLRMRSIELGGVRTWLGVPMLREGELIGALAVYRKEVRPFAQHQIDLLSTFADQAVIAIENVRLFNETKEALDQQRASSEVLGAISSSIADTKPVFDVILQCCQHLFTGFTVGLTLLRDDGMLDVGAYMGPGEEGLRRVFPQPLDRSTSSGIAILDRHVLSYPDVDASDMPPASIDGCRAIGLKSMVFAPMLSEGRAIGTLWFGRAFTGAFSDKQIALLRTFAEQAVIAIQNARAVQRDAGSARTADRDRRSIEVISESPTDVQPVFDTIVDAALRLCDARVANVVTFDGK